MLFNIQRFSLHDGDGVRTVVFFKGCPLRCRWCSNPESQAFQPEVLFDPAKCIGCRDCLDLAAPGDIAWNNGPVLNRPLQHAGVFRAVCPTEALTVAGEDRTPGDIVCEVQKDAVFYRGKGGLTLSGGEPFAQPGKAAELLECAKQAGLGTTVETCLAVPWRNIEPSLPHLDAVYADVKHTDPEKYLSATGGALDQPLDNLARLAKSRVPVAARIPVIPGFNHTLEELRAIVSHIAGLGIPVAHLMAYHTFGKNKYSLLGRDYPMGDCPAIAPESLEQFVPALRSYGPDIRLGG